MLQKITKVAEISPAFSSQVKQFFYAGTDVFICVVLSTQPQALPSPIE